MREISLKEMQQIELNLLLELDKVCKKYNLQYFMDGGTLLGAMCYEGFIPWDDDIDLKMPRKDYNKLLTLQAVFPEYIRLDAPSKEHYDYTMLKLIDDRTVLIEHNGNQKKHTGVYLDVFPMDGYPNDPEECSRHLAKLQKLNSLYHYSLEHFTKLKKSASFFTKIKGYAYSLVYSPYGLYQKLTREAEKYDYDQCKYVGLLIEGNPIKERFAKEWLMPGFTLEFEGHRISAPAEYRKHMEIFYGPHVNDPKCYHNLPQYPSVHNHEVYWKDTV